MRKDVEVTREIVKEKEKEQKRKCKFVTVVFFGGP